MKEGNTPVFGYSYDLWMFSVKATKSEEPMRNLDKLKCTVTEYDQAPIWFPFSDSGGVFYDFVSNANELGGTIFLRKNEKKQGKCFAVPWRSPEENQDVHYVKVCDEYKEQIIQALTFVVNQSPVRKSYLFIRRQCHDKPNLIGILTLKQIYELVMNDEILGNIVYMIHDA